MDRSFNYCRVTATGSLVTLITSFKYALFRVVLASAEEMNRIEKPIW